MTTAPTRRERQRQATYDEIVEVSRRLLREGEDVSVRGVAAEMGLTPPALYRYVDSHAELMTLVVRSVFDDVVDAMTVARDAQPTDDPAAQIAASSAAFRGWALTHREEFQLVFASPASPGMQAVDDASKAAVYCLDPATGVDRFGAFFAEIFGRLWERYRFAVPADDELDPEVLAILRTETKPAELTAGLGQASPGMIWMFERAWARLYGTVTLEVFGHVHPVFISSGALFRAAMLDIGRELGIDAEWGRLEDVVRGEL